MCAAYLGCTCAFSDSSWQAGLGSSACSQSMGAQLPAMYMNMTPWRHTAASGCTQGAHSAASPCPRNMLVAMMSHNSCCAPHAAGCLHHILPDRATPPGPVLHGAPYF